MNTLDCQSCWAGMITLIMSTSLYDGNIWGPVKLMLCFVSQVVRTAKSVGQDPNIIYGGQSVSSLTWKSFSFLIKKIIFWMNQGHLYIVALVVCKGNCWRDVEVIYNDQLQSRETPAVSPVFDHPWRILRRLLK